MQYDRRAKVGKSFREYLYHSAVQGKPLMGKELDMAVRANKAIADSKATLAFGSGNQVKDLQESDGIGRMTMSEARNVTTSLVSKSATQGLNIHSGTLSALSAEATRGANCGENADLTTHNLLAQSQDTSLKAQRMTLNPHGTANQKGSSEIDHAFSQLVSTEQETNWEKQSTGKWQDIGDKTVQRKMIADSWITGAHAVRDKDFAFSGVASGVRYESTVRNVDHIATAKSKLGITSGHITAKQQQLSTEPHDDFAKLKKANGTTNRLHLWGNNSATNKAFKQATVAPLQKRNALLGDVRGFDQPSLKAVTTVDKSGNDLARQRTLHQTFAQQGVTVSGRKRSKSVGDLPGGQV